MINTTLVRDNGSNVLNAHEVTIGFSQRRDGSDRKPIVRCRISFKAGEEDKAALIASKLRDFIDEQFPDAKYGWDAPLPMPSNLLGRLLRKLGVKLSHLEFRANRISLSR